MFKKIVLVIAAFYAASANAASDIASRIDGKEISDLKSSGDYVVVDQGVIEKVSPIVSDAVKRHYHIDQYTARSDGAGFVIFASYLDDEDGGNSYGWVESVDGKVIARIGDSFIEALADDTDNSSLRLLNNAPRALAPALDLNDRAARHAYLSKLVEEFEQRRLNPDGDGDTHLDVYAAGEPCAVAADGSKATCVLDYLQDRWNGILRAEFALSEDGKAIVLNRALFGGNF